MKILVNRILQSCLVLMLTLKSINGYNILVVSHLPTKSHFILTKGIANSLREFGHNVTFVSPFPSPDAKFKDLPIPTMQNLYNESIVNINTVYEMRYQLLQRMAAWVPELIKTLMDSDVIKNLKNEQFDVVILEHFLNEGLFGLGLHFKCPVILFSSFSITYASQVLTENPALIATTPSVFSPFTTEMNIWERTINFVMYLFQKIYFWWYIAPAQKQLYQKYFPKEAKNVPFEDLNRIISGMVINSHPSISIPRAYFPNAVEVAGYHINENEPLTDEFQTVMDSANNGVIYFSMGSNIKSSQMNANTQNIILNTFSTLKETFLWKFEKIVTNLPKNVLIRSWLPQIGILAHRNTKVFITQGGILSCSEAVHFGIPMLIIPIYGDQHHNANMFQKKGNAIVLEFSNVSETSLSWAINELVSNPTYKENALELQTLFLDRPVHPKELLVFHVEHILRTDGGKHLTPPRLSMISKWNLDAIAVLLLPFFIFIIFLKCLSKRNSCKKPDKFQDNMKKFI